MNEEKVVVEGDYKVEAAELLAKKLHEIKVREAARIMVEIDVMTRDFEQAKKLLEERLEQVGEMKITHFNLNDGEELRGRF